MKIAVIGAGAVGVAVCADLLAMGECRELVLVDLNRERAEGEVMDFSHTNALVFSKNTRVLAGDYADVAGSDIVIITAGAQIKVGQDRKELAEVNSRIAVDIARQVERHAPRAILIVVTNPCDILAHFIIANTGFTPDKVISAGCIIDTARLMKILGDRVALDPKNIFAMVLGEHGQTAMVPWSVVNIAGQSLDEYCAAEGLPPMDKAALTQEMRQAGLEIFRRKLNTNHGIAASVFRIVRAIVVNEHSVLPVGALLQGAYGLRDVVLGVPAVVNARGIERLLHYRLPPEELQALHASARALQSVVAHVRAQTGLAA